MAASLSIWAMMFVGIQHPDAPFPDGPGSLPRSSIVAIKRVDGALVG